ncbi:MAG: DUF502 domain-containing protein [Chloroflexi bacterium]|nr:DUF502 domain-containing protein [Chloroflexota bacterium]
MSTANQDGQDQPEKTRANLWQRVKQAIGAQVRRTLITGSLLLLPVALTYLILRFIFDVVDGVLNPGITWLLARMNIDFSVPGVGVVVAVVLLYLAGFVLANSIGRKFIAWGQKALLRVPVIGTVYSASQKLVESFSGKGETGFKRVVLLQYPQQGNWTIGFLTSVTTAFDGKQMAVVYIPTAPTPTSGWVAIVPWEEVYDTDITVPVAMQMVFSGGIVTPDKIKTVPLSDTYQADEERRAAAS